MKLNFKGGPELATLLEKTGDRAPKVLRGGLRAFVETIAAEARSKADPKISQSIKTSTRLQSDGTITAKVVTRGRGAYLALWAEIGTKEHWIKINPDARPTYTTRHGVKKLSIGTLNRLAHSPESSIKIGENFVGQSVLHPGAEPHEFLLPAFDTKAGEALNRMGEYLADRLAKEGVDAGDLAFGADDEADGE